MPSSPAGIEVPTIEFEDNQPTLALIDTARTGLFAMIDEEMRLPGGSDEGYLSKVLKAHAGKDSTLCKKTHVKAKDARACFTVVHFAGDVNYNVTHFLEKNRDRVPDDVKDVMATAQSEFVSTLMNLDDIADEAAEGHARADSKGGEAAAEGAAAKGKAAGKKKAPPARDTLLSDASKGRSWLAATAKGSGSDSGGSCPKLIDADRRPLLRVVGDRRRVQPRQRRTATQHRAATRQGARSP